MLYVQSVRSGGYLNILNDQAFPLMEFSFLPNNTGIFQDDSPGIHLAQIVRVVQGS